jgi:hypothetical protein
LANAIGRGRPRTELMRTYVEQFAEVPTLRRAFRLVNELHESRRPSDGSHVEERTTVPTERPDVRPDPSAQQ